MANGEWDVFGANWGLGMPIDWFDVTAISALLDDPRLGQSRIGQLILGYDGEEVSAWDEPRRMLRAFGFFPGETYEGKITFSRLRLANIEDAVNPTIVAPIPRTLKLEPAEGEGIDRLVATVGETPWSDGRKLSVNLLSSDSAEDPNSLRAGLFTEERQLEFDLSVLSADDEDAEEVGLSYLSLVKIRSYGAPHLFIKAVDPGTLSHGDIVKVGDPQLKKSWFVDADNNTVEVDSNAKWFGQIVGFRRNIGNGSIDLTLLMHQYHINKFPRLRAPSAKISATVSTTTYAVESTTFGGPSGDDATEFTVDDYVELWTPWGTRRSGSAGSPDVQQVTALAAGSVELDADFTTTAEVGDILRYARLDTGVGNPEDDSAKLSGVVAYAFMADAAGTISPSDLDAHIYGFGII